VLRNALIVGALAAIAVAALVDTLQGGDGGGESTLPRGSGQEQLTLTGPNVPAPGALPGSLAVVEAGDCRLRVISFEDASLGEPGAQTLCRVWASPSSPLAVVATSRGERADLRELSLIDLDDPSDDGRTLGSARGEVAWSPDGGQIAWCSLEGATSVLELESGARREVPGCDPAYAPDGALLTRPDGEAELWRDGEPLLTADDLGRGFEPGTTGPVELVEYDVSRDGAIAATVARPLPTGTSVVLELWRDGSLGASFDLPAVHGPGNTRFGGFLRFSPAGNELAVGYTPGAGALTLVDLDLERLVIPEIDQSGLTWSPDGAWLALAVGDEIHVYGATKDEPTYVLPIAAQSIAWSPGEEEPAAEG
jgi:hypothetical protein